MVLPVIAYYFNQISLAGLLANSLVLWSVPLVMISGFVAMLLGLISQILGQIIGLIPGILLTYFIYIVELFAKIPGASFQVYGTGIMMWVGYYLVLAAGVWKLKVISNIEGADSRHS